MAIVPTTRTRFGDLGSVSIAIVRGLSPPRAASASDVVDHLRRACPRHESNDRASIVTTTRVSARGPSIAATDDGPTVALRVLAGGMPRQKPVTGFVPRAGQRPRDVRRDGGALRSMGNFRPARRSEAAPRSDVPDYCRRAR